MSLWHHPKGPFFPTENIPYMETRVLVREWWKLWKAKQCMSCMLKCTKNYCVVLLWVVHSTGSEQICKTSKCFFLSSYDWIQGNVSIDSKWSFMYLLRGICWAWRDQGMIMWVALYADRPHGSTTQKGVSLVTAQTKADTEAHLQAWEKHWPGSAPSTSSQKA